MIIRFLQKHIIIIAILLFAAFLRLYKIDQYMTFLGDEGRDAITLYNIVHGDLTLLGPTASVGGFFMGPAYYYIVAPFFWLFGYNPVGPAIMVALLSVATVWFIYKIGTDFFSKKAGLLGAVLYALSPLVIIYSRSSWNPNVMPFFTILTLYTLYKGIQRKNTWLVVFSGFLFGIDIQLHYIELFLGLVIILYVILMHAYTLPTIFSFKYIQQVLRDGICILIGFLLGFSPFIAFEARHGFLNSQSIYSFIFQSGETGTSDNYFLTVWNVMVRLFGRLLTDFPLPQDFSFYNPMLLSFWYALTIFLTILCFGYLIIRYGRSYKDVKRYPQMLLLLLWLCIGVSFFGFYKRAIYDYYFAFLFPLPFLLIGGILAEIYDNTLFVLKNRIIIWLMRGAVFLLLVTLITIFIYNSPLKPSPNIQFQKTKEIADFVLSKTDGKPFNFALITGGNSDHGYRYFFIREGKEPVVIQNPQLDPKRETVTDQLLVICDSLPCSPLGHSLWEVAGFGRAKIVGHWKVSYVEVYKLAPYTEE